MFSSTGSSSASAVPLGRFSHSYDDSSGSRKRSRPSHEPRHVPSRASLADNAQRPAHNGSGEVPRLAPSPLPLTNAEYRLRGGHDSTMLHATTGLDEADSDYDRHCRRQWTSVHQDHEAGYQRVTVEALQREANGRKRRRAMTEQIVPSQTWGSYVFEVFGGLAGKFMGLWRGGEFTGFQAGGGVAYTMTSAGPQVIDAPQARQSSCMTKGEKKFTIHTSIPGQFPQDDDDDVGYDETLHTQSSPSRPSKRLQTSQAGDWIVVEPGGEATEQNRSPGSQRLHQQRLSQASRQVVSKRSQPRTGRRSTVSHAGSPHILRSSEASTASARSPKNSPRQPDTPLSIEVERYQARKHYEEKQNDASMRKLNKQLKAMIQEGKAALATKYEVQDAFELDEDEGFADDFELASIARERPFSLGVHQGPSNGPFA